MTSVLKVDTIQNTGGTTGLTINSNGFVLPKSYAFRAKKTSATNWTSGGGTGKLIAFNHTDGSGGTGDYSFNSGFDLSTIGTTGKVSPPVNGIYQINFQCLLAASNTGTTNIPYCGIMVNATTASGTAFAQNYYEHTSASEHAVIHGTTLVKLTTSDYFGIAKEDSFKYWGNGANNHTDWNYNYVTCQLISTT
jgi:hypothetical protein